MISVLVTIIICYAMQEKFNFIQTVTFRKNSELWQTPLSCNSFVLFILTSLTLNLQLIHVRYSLNETYNQKQANERQFLSTKVIIKVLWWTDSPLVHGDFDLLCFKTDLLKDEILSAKDFISVHMQTLALKCSLKI